MKDVDESIFSALKDKAGTIPFHMPGHKRNEKFDFLKGMEQDFTELDGLDDLHNASGVISLAEKRAARVFNSMHVRFLVGGSTVGVLAGIRTLTKRSDKILVASNCHKSVFNAAQLLSLKIALFMPNLQKEGIFGDIDPQKLEEVLTNDHEIKLFVLTSPTYEGVISDIKKISEICAEHGVKLLVDEAHGAHLGLFGGVSAREYADITVNSLHKTLACLTPAAILSYKNTVDETRLNESLQMFETSSPPYYLLCAMDSMTRYLEDNKIIFDEWRELVLKFKRELKLKNLKLFAPKGVCGYDDSKIVILSNMGGKALKDELAKRNIEAEMYGVSYVLAMTGIGTTREDLDALKRALEEIDGEFDGKIYHKKDSSPLLHALDPQTTKKAVEAYETDGLSAECVDIEKCEGRVSMEYVWAYPPGSPIILKGFEISSEQVEAMKLCVEENINAYSSSRAFPKKIWVRA